MGLVLSDRQSKRRITPILLGGGISIIMVLIWPLLMLENVVQDLGNFSLQILMVHNLQIQTHNSDFNTK